MNTPNTPPVFTGTMTRADDGSIKGELVDVFGWAIVFKATRTTEGYALTGWRGTIPAEIRIPLIDDAARR